MNASNLSAKERKFLDTLSRLATCNPFLPERVELEREVLEGDFEDVSPVWSKRLDRQNPNVVKLAGRAEAMARKMRGNAVPGRRASPEETRLYEELAFYVLYYRFEEDFGRAMSDPSAPFYETFCRAARELLSLPTELPHWFSFLFQIRRASHYIFEFIVGSSLPAARLRASIWQSIFTHDIRRYRRALFEKMGDVSTLVTGPSGTGKELVARAVASARYIPFQPKPARFAIDVTETFYPLNLSAMAPTLIESELFGHRRGAFTGALT
ncbi:MAG: sigma 54-interacting transcriptional regulator, partial [Vicinamibacteria bacterium]